MGNDPAYPSQSEQDIESVLWKLSWHFPPLVLPSSSWVRLPRELLWWLIDFNLITRLQKSRQKIKVLGTTTPWFPHPTSQCFSIVILLYCVLKGHQCLLLKLLVYPTADQNGHTNISGRKAHQLFLEVIKVKMQTNWGWWKLWFTKWPVPLSRADWRHQPKPIKK